MDDFTNKIIVICSKMKCSATDMLLHYNIDIDNIFKNNKISIYTNLLVTFPFGLVVLRYYFVLMQQSFGIDLDFSFAMCHFLCT